MEPIVHKWRDIELRPFTIGQGREMFLYDKKVGELYCTAGGKYLMECYLKCDDQIESHRVDTDDEARQWIAKKLDQIRN